MASYLIMGAGKFGRLTLKRLTEKDREALFLVIDWRARALAEARTSGADGALMIEGEAIPYLPALSMPGPDGELYLSQARHLCPDDCAEPPVCPGSREERQQPLFRKLAETSRPERPILVVASRQLAPGVGGYSPQEMVELAATVAEASEPLLVATACRFHGLVHGLKRKGERPA